MQLEVSNFQELIALARQYNDDPQTLGKQTKIVTANFYQAKDALYSSFGTNREEWATYKSRNGRAVTDFLEANPAIKQQIDELSAQLMSVIQEYASLNMNEKVPPPPLP